MVVGDDVPVLRNKKSRSLNDIHFFAFRCARLVSGSDADAVENKETAHTGLGNFLLPGNADHGGIDRIDQAYGLFVLVRQ